MSERQNVALAARSVVVRDDKIRPIQHLRGLAVLLTVLAHLPLATEPWSAIGLAAPYWIGVVLFYGVSGYVIFLTTERKDWSGLSGFYVRRFMRIAPILLVSCGFAMLMSMAIPHQFPAVAQFYPSVENMAQSAAAQVLMIGNLTPFLGIATPLCILGLWSISVEAQFYFSFGWFLALAPRSRAIALIVVALALFTVKLTLLPAIATSHMFFYEALLVSAAACHFRNLIKAKPLFALIALVYAFLFPLLPMRIGAFVVTYPILVISVSYIAVCAGHGTRLLLRSPKTEDVLGWLGERSYVIYVMHFQVLAVAGLALQWGAINFHSPLGYSIGLAFALVAAIPLYEFLHKTVEAAGIRVGHMLSAPQDRLEQGPQAALPRVT